MLFHTVGQAQVFLGMLYAGLLIGAWYDGLGFVRRVLQAGPWLTACLDVVFSLGAGYCLIAFLLLTNFGEMRLFCLLGALCGAILYVLTLRQLLRGFVVRPCRALGRFLKRRLQSPLSKKIFR